MSVTAAKGWRAAGVRAGTKPSGEPDLALVVSDHPAAVAGAFTANKAVCAHIIVDRPRVVRGSARGVLISAGIANAATGQQGVEDTERMAALAADASGWPAEEMLVCATGVIGGRIPVDVIAPAISAVAGKAAPDGGHEAALAIMTTDTRPKESVRTIEVNGTTVTVGGMAKGAGMIAPRMQVPHATMLAFLTTDGAASPDALRAALARTLPDTFNAITVDGSMSTNDTVLLFANGAAGVDVGDSPEFVAAVHEVMADLSYAIVADGEGASKVIRIRVTGAASDDQAREAAREVSKSLLFRAAIWGGDPNAGRVIQSIGQAPGVDFDPDRVRVWICGVQLADGGIEVDRFADAAAGLGADEIEVVADLGLGDGRGEILTCDLTPEYVKFNADYTT